MGNVVFCVVKIILDLNIAMETIYMSSIQLRFSNNAPLYIFIQILSVKPQNNPTRLIHWGEGILCRR